MPVDLILRLEKGSPLTNGELDQNFKNLNSGKADILIGAQKLSPFRSEPLWYFMNGDNYLLDSPQGQALNSLSNDYKADWGIAVTEVGGQQVINVPNYFYLDGRGYFERAVDGTARGIGTSAVQLDAQQRLTGSFSVQVTNGQASTGVFVGSTASGGGAGGATGQFGYAFDSARQARTDLENRSINIGKMPLIYLGV